MAKQKSKNAVPKPAAEKLNRKGKQKTTNAVRRPAAEKLNSKGKQRRQTGVLVLTPDMMEDYERKEHEYYQKTRERNEKKYAEMKQFVISLKEDKIRAVARLRVRGFVFNPSDEVLVDLYLKEKNLGRDIDLCPIEEVDVYGTHPQTLTEKYTSNGGVWHFFTQSRPNENSGEWEFGEKNDVFCNGVKVGVRQEVEYSSGDGGGKYKMMEYQLEPATEAAAPWFICKLVQWRDTC